MNERRAGQLLDNALFGRIHPPEVVNPFTPGALRGEALHAPAF